ncbi:MAG: PD-(D/E)XK nuclease family protein [Anaerolineae bacterium]|nr:PD-(D/E)XK nuclease family protein [Anaerolineae bacterium]
MTTNNIFVTLSGHSSEENYLTEAFVFLVALLLEHDATIGLKVLNGLIGEQVDFRFDKAEGISISTQFRVDNAIPDIVIKQGPDALIYIEVKHDSPLGERQLWDYFERLKKAVVSHTRLVLLTRSLASVSVQETGLQADDYHHICWYHIHNWLSGAKITDDVCRYFIHDFLSFLEGKNMNIPNVAPEYSAGILAFENLMRMLETAITEAIPRNKLLSLSPRGGWSWRGFNVNKGIYYCGIRYNKPLLIVFENNYGTNPTFKRDFNLEAEGFFSLTSNEQFERIIRFVKESYLDDHGRSQPTLTEGEPA